MDQVSAPIFALGGFGFGYVIGLRFGMAKGLLFIVLVCAMLMASGCGGGTADGLVGVEQTGVVCPEDPATFVGPVQAECMLPMGSAG